MPVFYSLLKAKAIRLWPEAELLSISVGLSAYAKASPFSLVLAMPVWDQVVSLLSELKLLTVHMKRINPIKILFPSIHPPYISWFYLNQSNFFKGLFSELNVSSKKGQNQDEATASSCLMLVTALIRDQSSPKSLAQSTAQLP